MEIGVQSSVRHARIKEEQTKRVEKNLIRAVLYDTPPMVELSLEQFELLALNRLSMLRHLDVLRVKKSKDLKDDLDRIQELYLKNDFKDSSLTLQQVDEISHFLLRLGYCQTEDNRRWFISQETELYNLRLQNNVAADELDLPIVPPEEMRKYGSQLADLESSKSNNNGGVREKYFKVPFTEALTLVANRSVLLVKGFAYVSSADISTYKVGRFRSHLSGCLTKIANAYNPEHFDPSDRIGPLLKNLHNQFAGLKSSDSSNMVAAGKLTPDMVDHAASRFMPMCMRRMHNHLRRESQMKHDGRLQYGLFLMGAGLSMDDAERFWASHFTKKISQENFVKTYRYNIRHMYGQEGGRKKGKPFSCVRIITGPVPTANSVHGCPFRHSSEKELSQLLFEVLEPVLGKNASEKTKELVTMSKQHGHYQVSCRDLFELMHPGGNSDGVANFPNEWYNASVLYHQAKSMEASAQSEINGTDMAVVSPSS